MSELIDYQAQRVRILKGIIKRLHAGEAPKGVRASLRDLVRQNLSQILVGVAGRFYRTVLGTSEESRRGTYRHAATFIMVHGSIYNTSESVYLSLC